MPDLMAVQDLEMAYYQELFGVAATDGLTLPDLRYIYFLNAYNGTLGFLTSDTISKVEKVTQEEFNAMPLPRPEDVLYIIVSNTVSSFEKVTQAEYDAMIPPRPADVLYVITP